MTALYRAGSGSTLVLLHGVNMSWRAWRPVLRILERRHTLYVPTLPGHRGGLSLPTGAPVTVDTLADVLGEQLDEDGITNPHIAGNSLGGWVALELARRGRARSVTALSPAGAWTAPADMRRLVALFRIGVEVGGLRSVQRLMAVPWLRHLMMRTLTEHAERFTPDDMSDMFADMAGCTVIDDLLAHAQRSGSIETFGELPCPVRIAWSGRDRTIPFQRYGRPMLSAVPGAELVILPGVGHVPMIDNPHLVAWTILQTTQPLDRRAQTTS